MNIGTHRICALLTGLLALAAPGLAIAQPTHQLLAASGDPVPLRTTMFVGFDHVRILDGNDVAFVGETEAGRRQGVFLATAEPDDTSTLTPVLQADDAAQLMGSPMSQVVRAPALSTLRIPLTSSLVYAVTRSGAFAIGADYRVSPTLPDQWLGLFRVTPPGAYEHITDGRMLTIPSAAGGDVIDSLDGNVLEAAINGPGDVLFLMGGFSRFGTGLFVVSGTTFRNVAYAADPALNDPMVIGMPFGGRREILDVQLADTGTVMFQTDNGSSAVAVWRERAGAIEAILVEGPAPFLLGETISDVADVVLGPTGRYAILCELASGGQALYGGSDSDAMELFAESAPGGNVLTPHAGGLVELLHLDDVIVSPAGNYFFTATAALDDGTPVNGIWRRTGTDGTLAHFLRDPTPLGSPEEPLRNLVIQDINLTRDVVFSATQQSPLRSSLWIRRGAEYSPLVTEGDVIEGLEVTNARADGDVIRATLSADSHVALRLGVDDSGTPREALFFTDPGEPAPPDEVASLGFLTAGSVVSFDDERITFRMLVFNDGPEDVTPGFSIDIQATGENLSDPQMVFSAEAGPVLGPGEVMLRRSSPEPATCIPTLANATNLDASCSVTTMSFVADGLQARSVDVSFAYDGAGPYEATFTIQSPLQDADLSDNTHMDSVTLSGANLSLSGSAPESGLTAIFEIRNDGPETARDVVFQVRDTQDNELDLTVVSPALGPGDVGCERPGEYVCRFNRLLVGDVIVIQNVTATGSSGCRYLEASALADTMDPDETNNTVSVTNGDSGRCPDSGCSVGFTADPPGLWSLIALIGLVSLRRRRCRSAEKRTA